MANDVFFLTKHLILFVNVVLWFYFCLPSQCFVTTTKNKALVPIRTHTALPQLSGLISLSFSLFPLLSLHSYTSLAFSANSLPPRVFFLWILCWFPEIICSMNSQFSLLPLRAVPDDLYEEFKLYLSVKEAVSGGLLYVLILH